MLGRCRQYAMQLSLNASARSSGVSVPWSPACTHYAYHGAREGALTLLSSNVLVPNHRCSLVMSDLNTKNVVSTDLELPPSLLCLSCSMRPHG